MPISLDARRADSSESSLMGPRLAVCLMLGVLAVACCLPAVEVMGKYVPGWMCLMGGYIYPPSWVANPLFFIGCGCLALGRDAAAFWCGLGAAVLAGVTPVFVELKQLSWGYYLWAADMVLLALFAGLRSLGNPQNAPDRITPFARRF